MKTKIEKDVWRKPGFDPEVTYNDVDCYCVCGWLGVFNPVDEIETYGVEPLYIEDCHCPSCKDKTMYPLKTDGEEALEAVSREKPDLIIMDIRLPKMDGLEVTRRLRQMPISSHIPIIAVTAYAMKGDKEKIIGAGCDAYLPKPINTLELPGVIAQMLQQH